MEQKWNKFKLSKEKAFVGIYLRMAWERDCFHIKRKQKWTELHSALGKHHLVHRVITAAKSAPASGVSFSLGVQIKAWFKCKNPFHFDDHFPKSRDICTHDGEEILWTITNTAAILFFEKHLRQFLAKFWNIKAVQVMLREAHFHLSYLPHWYKTTQFAFILENDLGLNTAPSDAPESNASICLQYERQGASRSVVFVSLSPSQRGQTTVQTARHQSAC